MTLCPRLVPASQLNEGMTIVVTGLLVGVGVGSAIAGQVIETAGAHRAFIVPIAAAGIAFAIAVLGRTWLTEAERRAVLADPLPTHS
jgi:predicted MFS family arabinose efflux permease